MKPTSSYVDEEVSPKGNTERKCECPRCGNKHKSENKSYEDILKQTLKEQIETTDKLYKALKLSKNPDYTSLIGKWEEIRKTLKEAL